MTGTSSGLASALADRYAIERELGSGGMATVYLAKDLKHRRQVAIKVLKPELAAALGAERFLREIEVTAGLTHPHILPLHDSGEADGFLYYVMPYVTGESLRARLERETQLSVDDALRITQQVASALEFAHHQGVVHRDIKPENILLHAGEAVVADFGIALAVSAAGGERLTETGLSLGTPEYMSPEQALGEGEPDARSDIYSLACVLYEMLVGEPPYTGPTGIAVLAKRLSDPVPRARRLRAAIPETVDAALLRALARERVERYGSMAEFAEALVAEAGAEVEAVKSIVVLPFANLSADPEQEYFCDGMTEEIISALTHVDDLKVIARTSSFAFKDRQEDVREIGKRLGVDHLLEGSVRKAGNRLRITAQLIKAADGRHLWSERYDRDMEDVFAVQDEIALAIVDTLKVKLLKAERVALTKRYTDNLELYNLYLLGRYHWNKFTQEGLAQSVECYEQAIQKDPGYALAYAGAAEVSLYLVFFVGFPPRNVIPKAKAYVKRALEIEPHLPEAHAFAGRIYFFYDWDRTKADAAFQRALRLDPNSAFILSHYADFLSLTDQHEQAVVTARKAVELDPLNSFLRANAGERLIFARRFDEAIELLQESISLDPEYYWTHFLLGICLTTLSRLDEAIPEMEIALEASAREPLISSYLASAYWRSGAKSSADELLHEIEAKAEHEYVPASFLACIYNTRGEIDRAFSWFERALKERDLMMPYLVKIPDAPMGFPDEQRFTDRLREVGLLG
jgi:serine/threonine-protein kinase